VIKEFITEVLLVSFPLVGNLFEKKPEGLRTSRNDRVFGALLTDDCVSNPTIT
jgi:hypothetical protein